ncbi:protein CONSERVED IN THE GREEN LINEAGE AND DIATOMS 27, chloroplastic isoform X2 [Cucumis melo]|uniref:Protein CONSERVED IN THE GREEN LINEAGE AND DIATOMS 27, chloroplastic isoform X2 n=1 Tax=Cucumis melo TaxID=3656 RepID=A0A9I9DNN0_CUCME|nr:protein CONSERVED IN THE GREEN LINEAGE AND DIATOMS 27, chloroplastic isoform X2 [Cucumis melo]
MLRLNLYCTSCCSLIRNNKNVTTSFRFQLRPNRRLNPRVLAKALKDDQTDGGGGRFSGQKWDPGLEIEVPFEQRPVNEYSSLKDSTFYSWGELGAGPFFIRLGGLWLGSFIVLGIPVAAASFNPSRGWSYVGDRLLSAVIPYEESGWYDGQMWVKPPEVLARDRLLGSYKVKPVINMLKQTLVGTGIVLVSGVLLFIFATPVEDFLQTTFSSNQTLSSSINPDSNINKKYNLRKDQLLRLPVEVMADDELAAAAAEAADGRPVYCRDRYYRALAGGQYCKWEDLIK